MRTASCVNDANVNREGVGVVADPDPAVDGNWSVHSGQTEYDAQDRLLRYDNRCLQHLAGESCGASTWSRTALPPSTDGRGSAMLRRAICQHPDAAR